MKPTREYIAMWGSLIIASIKIETVWFWAWIALAFLYGVKDFNKLKK